MMTAERFRGFSIRAALLIGAALAATAPTARAEQFVLFDVTFTYTKQDADTSTPSKSHYYVRGDRLNKDRPRDWTAPVDYRNGTAHVRLQVIEKPAGGAPTTWSICYIPNKGRGNGYGCTSTPVYREPGVYERDVPMTEFWQNDAIVWAEGIKQMDLVIKDDSGGQGHAHRRKDPENYFPTRVRMTVVQVSAGSKYDPSQVPDLPPRAEPAAAKDQPKAKAARRYAVPPTFADVAYGDHPRQVLDFFKAEGDGPRPLVVHIHGGGWVNGDKVGVADLKRLLDSGISVASINYRFTTQAQEAGVEPPVKWPLEDAARAVQFLRSKAGEWDIDKGRIAATGGSAGACSSLWLAFHDDMAAPDSPDPVARESTRLAAAAVNGAQTSLDPVQLREWIPNMRYGGHAFGFTGGAGRDSQFQRFYDHRDEVLRWIEEYSPYAHVGADDPPVFLNYPAQDKPPVKGEPQKDPTHTAVLGLLLEEKLKAVGDEVHLVYPGHQDPEYASGTDFLIARLKGPGR